VWGQNEGGGEARRAAPGEWGAIAEEANVDRAGLYRSLRGDMDPAFGTVLKVLASLGIQLVAKPAAAWSSSGSRPRNEE